MYLKVITPRVTFEVAPGDIVHAGVVVTNSEVGCGTLSVHPLILSVPTRPATHVFKPAWFGRAARKARIGDPELRAAIVEVMQGLADDLGGEMSRSG